MSTASRSSARAVVRLRPEWEAVGDGLWILGCLAVLDFALIRSVRWGDNLIVAMVISVGSYGYRFWRGKK